MRGSGSAIGIVSMIRAGRPPSTCTSRERDGLIDRMGDQHHRLAGALPDIEQTLPHFFAGYRVERAERLVHQQDFGIERERRAMATRCCMPPESCRGRLASAPSSPTRRSISRAAPWRSFSVAPRSPRSSAGRRHSPVRSSTAAASRPETLYPIMRCRAASCGASPATLTSPSAGRNKPAMIFKSVLLPQPESPISDTKLPLGIVRSISARTRCRWPLWAKSSATPRARM